MIRPPLINWVRQDNTTITPPNSISRRQELKRQQVLINPETPAPSEDPETVDSPLQPSKRCVPVP